MNYDVKTLRNMDKNELIEKFLSMQETSNSTIEQLNELIIENKNTITNQEKVIAEKAITITNQTTKIEGQTLEIKKLHQRIDWLHRQIFGKKSEKVLADNSGMNQYLLDFGTDYQPEETPPEPTVTVKAYEKRCRKKSTQFYDCDGRLKYDETVPVEEVVIMPKEVEGLAEDKYEVIGSEVKEAIIQRPSSHYVKRVIRKTVKLKEPEENQKQIITAPLPSSVTVIENSVADVTFLAGLLENKFRYHIPTIINHCKTFH